MSRKKSTNDVINQANICHHNKYDYSEFVYIGINKKSIIICTEHGEFLQTPDNHIRGRQGCPKCSGNYKKSINDFIKKAQEIYGDRFDYSKFEYKGARVKGIITCKTHGQFEQTPGNHYKYNGCKSCKKLLLSKIHTKTFDEFIIKSNEKHHNKYDYSKFIFVDGITVGIIICAVHGEFLQIPNYHINGSGCKLCSNYRRLDKTMFVSDANKIHNNYYNYEKFIYTTYDIKSIIICPIHGEFLQNPNDHLSGQGCVLCGRKRSADKRTKSPEEFINEANIIHDNKYDYSLYKYINSRKKGIVICALHGQFKQSPGNHLAGRGCPRCMYKNQEMVHKYLEDNKYEFITQYFLRINGYRVFSDFYIPKLNLIIEYNGEQHYKPVIFNKYYYNSSDHKKAQKQFKLQQKRDNDLRKYCKHNNINLLEIDGRLYYLSTLKTYLEKLDLKQIIQGHE